MGVQDLLTYIDQNVGSCLKVVDLMEVVKQREVELMVDFYSFIDFLLPELYRNARAYYGNEFLSIPGGDYCLYHHWIMRIAENLRQSGINLVFFADGPFGASLPNKESKMSLMKERHEEFVKNMLLYVDICKRSASIDEFRLEDSLWPLLYDVQISESLIEAGFEFYQLAFGEADCALVHAFMSRGGFAVLSNDSDFAIFRDCVWMPLKYFDMENSLRIRYLPDKRDAIDNIFESVHLEKLLVGVVTSTTVMKALDLTTWPQLLDLSLIQGNDYTSPIIRKNAILWRETMAIPISNPKHLLPSIKDVANYICSFHGGCLQRSPQFQNFCEAVPEFAQACEYSYLFYNLNPMSTNARYKPGFITKCIEEVAPHLMAMHFGFYWHKVIVEDPRLMPIEILLSEIRRSLYRILCNQAVQPCTLEVMELGRSLSGVLDSAILSSDPYIKSLAFADQIHGNKPENCLVHIQRIMMQKEIETKKNMVSQFGNEGGFICLCLRFLLLLNWGQHLMIDEEEFMSLVAMAFGTKCLDLEFYYSLRILPTVRCITIFNWYQDIYRHAYHYLGWIYRISNVLPSPMNSLSAAMYFAFFMIRNPLDVPNLTAEQIERVRKERFQLIHKKRHLIKSMVRGQFKFSTGFKKI